MLKWLLFDLNSFFASCEQQEDPSLRGKPVAVVPMLTDSTSVIAASIQAKIFGIKTGTRVGDAKKMCPGLILRSGNHRIYTQYHHKILAAVEEILPIKKVLSIDEVACELIGRERILENATVIAQRMKDHVRKVVGSEIKSSVGIGPNILIAKMASDMQKPDGLIIIPKDLIRTKMGHLPIEAIPGVGRQMKIKLNAKGYKIVSDLMNVPEHELRKHWGSIWGLRVAKELQGEDMMFRESSPQNSFSHEHVLPPEYRTLEKSFQIMIKLLLKAATRARREKLKAGGLGMSIRFTDRSRFENEISFLETDDTQFFMAQLRKLWQPLFASAAQERPMKVGIVLTDLTDGPDQLSFFDSPKAAQRNEAMDIINDRFGANTLFIASTKEVLNTAKTRISFSHVPSLNDEFDAGD
ncbi:MAG: hypothetical protein H7328_08070 [Bdellovibrio sp.]|nr:hypothetical protein [Bdellovibrio sp.]